MSDEPFVWRGTVPVQIQMPSSISFVTLNKCLHCSALIADASGWEHEEWHRMLAGEHPVPALPMRSGLEDVMGHIDALYIFLGEKPPYNVGEPDA